MKQQYQISWGAPLLVDKADVNLLSPEESGDPFFLQQSGILVSHNLKAVSHFLFVDVFNVETNNRILFR